MAAMSTAARFDLLQDVFAATTPEFFDINMLAGTTIYGGTMVGIDTVLGGVARPASNKAGMVFAGIAELGRTFDNSAGADGALKVRVWPVHRLPTIQAVYTSPGSNVIGKLVYALTDNEVIVQASATNGVLVGRVMSITATGSAGQVKVDCRETSRNAGSNSLTI